VRAEAPRQMELVGKAERPGNLAMCHVREPEQGGGRLESAGVAIRRGRLSDLGGEVSTEGVVGEAGLSPPAVSRNGRPGCEPRHRR
jgi:hypothetical protein